MKTTNYNILGYILALHIGIMVSTIVLLIVTLPWTDDLQNQRT